MARKSKVPTPAELAHLYGAGHDALTAALDAGCLPADLQNKWPNLLGTLRRVEGQPYHRPGLSGREDPLTDDEKRVLAWEFRKAAQRAEEALKRCVGRAANPSAFRSPQEDKLIAVLQGHEDLGAVLRTFYASTRKRRTAWLTALDAMSFDQLAALRRMAEEYGTASGVEFKDAIVDVLDMRRSQGRVPSRNNPAWAKVFG